MADGGEGTLDAAVGSGFTRRSAMVSGPTGQPLRRTSRSAGSEAVIEMAAASGLAVLPAGHTGGGQPDPAGRHHGHEPGHRRTHPGRARRRLPADHPGRRRQRQHRRRRGLLQGLGARFLDADGNELPPAAPPWPTCDRIDFSGFDSALDEARFVLASDVDNPLLGPEGAAAIFGPQKGATPEDVALLDAALANFVDVLAGEIGPRAERPRTLRAPEPPAASATPPSRSWPRPAGRASTSCWNSPNWRTGWPAPIW